MWEQGGEVGEEVLLACFWLAAKLKQARKKLPVVAKVAAFLSMPAYRLNWLEVRLLDRLDWAPLRGWEDPRWEYPQNPVEYPVPPPPVLTPKVLERAMVPILYDWLRRTRACSEGCWR